MEMSGNVKWKLVAAILLLALSALISLIGKPAKPPPPIYQHMEPTAEQTAFLDALEAELRLLLAYRDAFGFYPQITRDTAWRAEVASGDAASRARFAEATKDGTLVFAVVSDREHTLRLLGVRGGAKMADSTWREGLAVLSRGNESIDLREFNGEPYAGGAQVFIPIEPPAERGK